MKRIIRTSFLIIGLGALLIIIGFMTGGRIKRAFYGYDEEWVMDNENTGTEISAYTPDTQLIPDVSVLKRLNVDIGYAVLRIEPHNEPFATYSITGNTKKLAASVRMDGNTLVISTKKRRNWLFGWREHGMGRPSTFITVKIPRNTAFETASVNIGLASLIMDGFTITKKFLLHTGAGSVTINDITATHVDIQTGVGETTFSGCTFTDTRMNTGVGDIAFRNCTFTDTVMHTGIGETSFDGRILKKLDIHAGIGEIDMQIHGKKADYAIDTTSGVGSILINGRSATGFHSTFRVNNQNAQHTIRVKAGIGQVSMTFSE